MGGHLVCRAGAPSNSKGNLGILVILRPAKLKLGPAWASETAEPHQQDAGPIGGHFAEPVWAP